MVNHLISCVSLSVVFAVLQSCPPQLKSAMDLTENRQNRLRFVYTHIKPRDQSPDKDLLISLAYFVPCKFVSLVKTEE